MLSKKQLLNVCLVADNTSSKCRYLSQDENDYSKFYCLKKSPKGVELDQNIATYVDFVLKKGKDPESENIPLGNNCDGYPILRYVEQGYDCP